METWEKIQESIIKSLGIDSNFKQEWKPVVLDLANGYYQIQLIHQTGIEVSLEAMDFEEGILTAIKRAKELLSELKKGKVKEYVFDGNKFNSPKAFFKYSEEILTYGLPWETGRNLDAFDDLLQGGFGRHGIGEIIKIKWMNMGKSRKKLDSAFYETLIDVLEKADNVIFERFEYH